MHPVHLATNATALIMHIFFASPAALAMSLPAAELILVVLCRDPLQLIETGSYNFCRMAIFSLDPHSLPSNPNVTSKPSPEAVFGHHKELHQSGSAVEGTETLCSQSAEPEHDHRNAADKRPAVDTTEPTRQVCIVAIAGHDPAVLELWSMAVSTLPNAHVPL